MTMKCNILIVDDEVSITQVLSSVLSEDGHHVDVAHSGEAALDMFAQGNYSLLISDIVMPGLSGIELLKKIKQISPTTHVIMMTSHAMLKTAIEALRFDADDYLIKPFDDILIISMITQRAVEKIELVQKNRILLEDLKMKNEEATRMNEVLRELAMQDGLTGLYNQRHFLELFAAELERSKRYNHLFSLLFLTVDHFIKFNDTHGHTAGDKVLRTLSDLLKKNTRKSNVVARYGFEEFAMILPEMSKEAAHVFAERIRTLVSSEPFAGRKGQPGGIITASIGVATFPQDGIDRKSIMDHARQKLSQAINDGRNRAC